MKYDHALGSYLYQTPMSMEQKVGADGYSTKGLDGTLNPTCVNYTILIFLTAQSAGSQTKSCRL